MLRVLVDSACSIKREENLGVDIIPLRILIGGKEYLDGVDIDSNLFYELLEKEKEFPKTSLPIMVDVESLVNKYLENGDKVIIVCLSSKISATFSVMKSTFNNENVKVIDSRVAVGGMRFIVQEILDNIDEPLDVIEQKVNDLIPRIRILAVPETLDYLLKGGRLKHSQWMIGKLLRLYPIITFREGEVFAESKQIGMARAMQYIAKKIASEQIDLKYGFIGAYTKDRKNLDVLAEKIKHIQNIDFTLYDDLIPSLAAHWGPNAFGAIYVTKSATKK